MTDTLTHPVPALLPQMQNSGLMPIMELLMCGRVFLVQNMAETSLDVPPEFWERNDVHLTMQLRQQIEADLDW